MKILFREVYGKAIGKKMPFYEVQINCISYTKTQNKCDILQSLNELNSSVFKPFTNYNF